MNTGGEDLTLAHRGLVFSQALTLYTRLVVYLYFGRLRIWRLVMTTTGDIGHILRGICGRNLTFTCNRTAS